MDGTFRRCNCLEGCEFEGRGDLASTVTFSRGMRTTAKILAVQNVKKSRKMRKSRKDLTSFRCSLMLALVCASNRCSVVMSTPTCLTSTANVRARSSLYGSVVLMVDTWDHLYLCTSLANACPW